MALRYSNDKTYFVPSDRYISYLPFLAHDQVKPIRSSPYKSND